MLQFIDTIVILTIPQLFHGECKMSDFIEKCFFAILVNLVISYELMFPSFSVSVKNITC